MTTRHVSLALILFLALGAPLSAKLTPKKTEGTKSKDGDAYAEYNRGIDLLQTGNYRTAQRHFEKAIAMKEDFAEAHNNLGYALRKQGEDHYDEALKHYDRAIELNPKLAEAYMYRGVLYVLSGDERNARRDLDTLNELDREMGDELLQVIASGEEPEGQAGAAARWQ